jgi:hypothetical protein
LETLEPSCVSRAAKPFIILVVHSPLGAMGHVGALKLPRRGGRARSHGTRGSTRTHLSKEARPGAKGHMAAPKLTLARRRGLGPWDTWQRQSPPWQEGENRGHETCGSTGAHLGREVRSGVTGHVVACGCTSCSLS